MSGGGTVAANARSCAAPAALAWVAACSACAAVVFIHDTYGCAALAIDADAAPVHSSLESCVITLSYPCAADCSSAASPFHADAAACSDDEPGPAYMRAELTSGINAP